MIEVKIELKETSQPIVLAAVNTYTKGDLFCVLLAPPSLTVQKFPVANIWRVTEDYK